MRGLVICALAACGRLGFTEVHDAVACDPSAPFGVPVLVDGLNSDVDDGTFRLAPDELSGYFWTERNVATLADLYFATRTDRASPFSVSPVAELDTVDPELDPALSADGSVLVFRRQVAGNRLHVASFGAGAFTDLGVITALGPKEDEQPYLAGDELYYSSLETGGGDIYRSTRTGLVFGAPTLVAELASTSDDGDPVVTEDGLTIYFRSDRSGNYDIYTASRSSTSDAFGAASLVDNVNLPDAADGPSWISPDGCRLYVSSKHAGGSLDIYMATR